jgi:hypothetical protein
MHFYSSICSTQFSDSHQRQLIASVVNRQVVLDDMEDGAPQPSRTKKPDCIFGLTVRNNAYSSTNELFRFDEITHQAVRELAMNHNISLGPFGKEDFSEIILPFAIAEAKNASGTYWPAVEHQVALPIRKFLRMQIQIQQAVNVQNSKCDSLVWFFGSIGPEWRVYGCFAEWVRAAGMEKEWRYVRFPHYPPKERLNLTFFFSSPAENCRACKARPSSKKGCNPASQHRRYNS